VPRIKLSAWPITLCDRVWNTDRWLPERWTVVCGHVQAACWSPCGSMVLFTTSEEPIVYSLTFSKLDTVFQHDETSKTAVPAVDLTEVKFNEGQRLVICVMHEDLPCSHLHDSVNLCFLKLSFTTATEYIGPDAYISGLYSRGAQSECHMGHQLHGL
jgi:aladin